MLWATNVDSFLNQCYELGILRLTKQYEEVTPISDLKKRGGSPGMEPYKVPYYFTSKKNRRQILPHFSMRQAILMILDPFSSIFHNCWLLAIHGNSLRFQVCPPLRSALNGLSAELSLRMGAHERSSCTCWDHFGEGKTIFLGRTR